VKNFLKLTLGPILLSALIILGGSALGVIVASFGVVVYLDGLQAGFTYLTNPLQQPDYPKPIRAGGVAGLYAGYRLVKALMRRFGISLEVSPSTQKQ